MGKHIKTVEELIRRVMSGRKNIGKSSSYYVEVSNDRSRLKLFHYNEMIFYVAEGRLINLGGRSND